MFKLIHREIELFKNLRDKVGTPEETIRLEYLKCFEKAYLKDEKQVLMLDGVNKNDFLMRSVDERLRRLGEIGTEVYDILEYNIGED